MTTEPQNESIPPVQPPPLPSLLARAGAPRRSVTWKLVWIGLLVVLLLVPLAMVRSVLRERLHRRNEAVAEITSTWGSAQTVCGPVLTVPYRRSFTVVAKGGEPVVQTVVEQANFLPRGLEIGGTLEPSVLHRGIYEAVVYRGALDITATFGAPSFAEWKIPDGDVLWDEAVISLDVTDLRGVQETVRLDWNGDEARMVPGTRVQGFDSGLHARLTNSLAGATGATCRIRLSVNGSSGLRVAPLGEQTHVRLSSPWPDPSFAGAFLPARRTVTADGFEAEWAVSYYGRSYPQQWCSGERGTPFPGEAMREAQFGVDLIRVVDAYRLVERSVKYGALFVVLVFTAFFLFEVLAALRLHPLQYLLVGMALVLFYLALLALSEVVAFGTAYLVGAAASCVLIVLYCAAVLQRRVRAAIVGAELVATYGFLYVVLRLQDYSLLIGTCGLMVALALVMYLTRKIDWYGRDSKAEER